MRRKRGWRREAIGHAGGVPSWPRWARGQRHLPRCRLSGPCFISFRRSSGGWSARGSGENRPYCVGNRRRTSRWAPIVRSYSARPLEATIHSVMTAPATDSITDCSRPAKTFRVA